jgi:hypothetical protein
MLECDDDRASGAARSRRRRRISSGSESTRGAQECACYAREWPVMYRRGPRKRPPIRARAGWGVREAMLPRIGGARSTGARRSQRQQLDARREAVDEPHSQCAQRAVAQRTPHNSTHRAHSAWSYRRLRRARARFAPRSHPRMARRPRCRIARARTSRAQSRTSVDGASSGRNGQPLLES